jgi:hypothetical protein
LGGPNLRFVDFRTSQQSVGGLGFAVVRDFVAENDRPPDLYRAVPIAESDRSPKSADTFGTAPKADETDRLTKSWDHHRGDGRDVIIMIMIMRERARELWQSVN